MLIVTACCSQGASLGVDSTGQRSADRSFAARERSTLVAAIHRARFNDIPHTLAPASCENTHPPEALATPSPLLLGADVEDKLIVSFIVGTDGRVHSALVLQGGTLFCRSCAIGAIVRPPAMGYQESRRRKSSFHVPSGKTSLRITCWRLTWTIRIPSKNRTMRLL